MISTSVRDSDRLSRLIGSCDRLIHPRLAKGRAREAQARLLAVSLVAPFFLIGLVVPAVAIHLGTGLAVATAGTVALAGLGCVLLLSSGRGFAVSAGILLSLSIAAASLGAACGAAPVALALIALALTVEGAWVSRSQAGLFAGAACASVPASLAFFSSITTDPAAAMVAGGSGLVYLGLCVARLAFIIDHGKAVADDAARPQLAARLDAVILRMTREGEVVEASEQARRILRLDPDLLTGQAFFERVRVSDRVGFLCALGDMAAERGTAMLTLRVPGARAGEVEHLAVSLELIRDGFEWIVVLRDASELAALREAREAAVETAAAHEAGKNRFLAGVSHELRTPLNAIIGFSEMLLNADISGPLPDKQGGQLRMIHEAGTHLLSLVNTILDTSKIEAGAYRVHPEPIAVRRVTELAAALMQPQAQAKAVTLCVAVDDAIGEIEADERALHQILLNLVSNALKFTPAGGRVDVSASRTANEVTIRVADTGIGIASDDLARLGQPFMQVCNDYTRRFEGTGLGLSLVKGLVALHGGTMTIDSAPGEGTIVAVALPVVANRTDPIRPHFKEHETRSHEGFRKTA